MNKDLDDRLIPNGEYRDAQNISVGKSEADDIGALETVLGNSVATNFGLNIANLKVLGYHSIENTNKIIVFLSNNSLAIPGTSHYIYEFIPTNTFNLLVTGSFLDFNQDFPISGISVIENLLFWTDNNNQPRKINIDEAENGTYYTQESHISVAKYNPYQPIGLLNKITTTTTGNTANPLDSTDTTTFATTASPNIQGDQLTMGRSDAWNAYGAGVIKIQFLDGTTVATDGVSDAFLNAAPGTTTIPPVGQTVQTYQANINVTIPTNTQFKFVAPLSANQISVADATGITKGMLVIQYGNTSLEAKNYVYIVNIAGTTITLNADVVVTSGSITFLSTTMTGKDITYNFNNEAYTDNTWPGDPDYLESRFIRLSYRFEFDDGEYSIIAPFTPITFIPKQKGYFLGSGGATPTADDENSTYRSTIVEFMENGVQNIELLIPFPDVLANVQPSANASYKIRSLDILYKESDAVAIKVIDTISFKDRNENGDPWTATTDSNIYVYNYQSRKPFRTLPTNQTIRVYDKVPVKALAQETSGNRIIYGNFLDKYSPPSFLNYVVGASPKSESLNYDLWAEFPTQSLKQNRNYQVGFVLADKFGRQSDVILSSVKNASSFDTGTQTTFGGDTIYSSYNNINDNTSTPIRDWFGDSLKVNITLAITSGTDGLPSDGEPGLYANTGTGYDTWQNPTATPSLVPTISGNTYEFNLGVGGQTQVPTIGSYLPGEFTDYVYVSNVQTNTPTAGRYTITTIGQVNSIYLQQSPAGPDVKYPYTINPIGWYSYKIVVKQQEQDYYNVYLPGILDGYPQIQGGGTDPYPQDEEGKTAHVVLINDNINKIPRDLSEVGPQQKQFRSSVQLYGRVENTLIVSTPASSDDPKNNKQFFPGILTDTAVTIATATDLNMSFSDLKEPEGHNNFYQLDTDPLIARISTSLPIGVTHENSVNTNMYSYLAIYETEPQESLLDIFWETPTVGLISTLNDAINSEYEGAVGWSNYTSNNFTEESIGNFLSNIFPVNQSGASLTNTTISTITVRNETGTIVTENFNAPTKNIDGSYNFSKAVDGVTNAFQGFVYNSNAAIRNFTITATITNNASSPAVVSNPLEINIELQNFIPLINAGVDLTSISTSTTTSGVINGVGIPGVNGAVSNTLDQDELQWSMTGGGTYFSINSTNGKITQTAAVVNTYSLIITLTDVNGAGLASLTKTQQVIVSSSIIGFPFSASPRDGNLAQACPVNGSQNPDCGTVTYYNTGVAGGGGATGTPVANDIIRLGPDGAASAFMEGGYYSYNCGPFGNPNTGTARNLFSVEYNTGKVLDVGNCGVGPF